MNLFNLIKVNSKTVFILIILILSLSIPLFLKYTLADFQNRYDIEKRILDNKKKENEKYSYVENILVEFKDNLDKYKSINNPDIFSFLDEVEKLFLNWVLIEKIELSYDNWNNKFTVTWLAPNMRAIDLQLQIINTFNELYWWFETPVSLNSVSSKNWVFSFSIDWKINWEKILNRIFSDDIDWDWIKDYDVVEIKNNTTWISQKKVVLNDQCPFTPKFNLTIASLVKNNENILNIFPYYKSMYEDWYFTLKNDIWCMTKWDVKINF